MKQPIIGGVNDALSQTATEYNCLMGGGLWGTTENVVSQCMPTAGTLGRLFIELSAAVAAGSTFIFKVVLAGAPSEVLKVTIGEGQTTGSCLSTIDVVAGQTVSIQSSYTVSPGTPLARWTVQFIGTTAGESICLANIIPSITLSTYREIEGSPSGVGMTQVRVQAPMPTPGTFKKLYVQLSADPGTPPDAYTIALQVGGASVNNTVTIVADNTTGNITNVTDVVAAGDLVNFIVTPISGPAANPYFAVGIVFVSDIDGESLIVGGTGNSAPSTSLTRYFNLGVSPFGWGSDETLMYTLAQTCTIKKLYVSLSAAPGAGDPVKSYTISINKDGGTASGLTVIISALETSGNDTAHTYNPADGDTADIQSTPANTPVAAYVHIGLVAYTPLPPTIGKTAHMADKMMAVGAI